MRCGFTGYINTRRLCRPYKLHALLSGDMTNVIGATRFLYKLYITLDRPPLAFRAYTRVSVKLGILAVVYITAPEQGIILAVSHYHFAESLRLVHRRKHHFLTLYATTVIREGNDLVCHTFHIRKFKSLLHNGYRAVRIDVYYGILFNNIELLCQILTRVRHRHKIGHSTHSGVSASCRRQRTGFYRFFIRKSRLTKMHVHIAKTGKNITIFTNGKTGKIVRHFRNRGNNSVGHEKIGSDKSPVFEYLCIFQQYIHIHVRLSSITKSKIKPLVTQ